MSETGFFIFLAAIIGVAVLGAVIAVIAAVSGASAAIADEGDSAVDVSRKDLRRICKKQICVMFFY